MTEYKKMIPLSVVDAKIKEIENDTVYQGHSWDGVRNHFINKIEEIKKEAIPNPYEQRIRDRLEKLKENLKTAEGAETFDIDSRIDELEDLILE